MGAAGGPCPARPPAGSGAGGEGAQYQPAAREGCAGPAGRKASRGESDWPGKKEAARAQRARIPGAQQEGSTFFSVTCETPRKLGSSLAAAAWTLAAARADMRRAGFAAARATGAAATKADAVWDSLPAGAGAAAAARARLACARCAGGTNVPVRAARAMAEQAEPKGISRESW